MPSRLAIAALCLVELLFVSPLSVRAEDYPSHPIHLIITTPAGSLIDVLGRILIDRLSIRLGQPIIIDNRPGGTTQIGIEALMRAPPDGYTLMIAPSEMTIQRVLKKSYRYEINKDYTPVALVTTSWTLFATYPGVPVKTLPELISYAKANPGKVHYGTNGVGSALHVVGEMLRLQTGIDIVHIPYRGGGQAATDAIAGQIEMVSMGLASARIADNGKLNILAQTGPSRHPMLPDVPTTAETGYPDVRMDTWFGVIAPAQTPDAIVARLGRALEEVSREPSFQDSLAKIGCVPAFLPQDQFTAYIASDQKKWNELIPAMGIPQID